MPNLFRHLRNPKVRSSTASSLDTAAKLPNSGFEFVDNSQGASAAVAELSQTLDIALEQVDFDNGLDSTLNSQLSLLDEEAAKYANSKVDLADLPTKWSCSAAEAEVVGAAWDCASAVYDLEKHEAHPSFETEDMDYCPASVTSVSRATLFRIVRTKSGTSPFFPMLVVAVRGTVKTSVRDNIVNANSRGERVRYLSPVDGQAPIEAHAGFLAAAETLAPKTLEKVKKLMILGTIKHVLFTGHSAGGAVSSLLFLKLFTCATTEYPSLCFSSITFGSPPVIRPDIGSRTPRGQNCGFVISFVNEFDLVPRADGAYVRSLVDLYRSLYDLPPIQAEASNNQPRSTFSSSDSTLVNGSIKSSNSTASRSWTLPKPDLWHAGDLVLLKLELSTEEDISKNHGGNGLALHAIELSHEDFSKLLFCQVAVHSRGCYHERVRMLLESILNREKD